MYGATDETSCYDSDVCKEYFIRISIILRLKRLFYCTERIEEIFSLIIIYDF